MSLKEFKAKRFETRQNKVFLDETHQGEIRVCRVRVIGLCIFYLNHCVNYYIAKTVSYDFHIKASISVFTWIVLGIIIWHITAHKNWYERWLTYLTTTMDVLFLSLILLFGEKSLNQIFVLYYPIIVLGGIRYSLGATLYAGAMSAVCYTIIAIRNDLTVIGHVDTMELIIRVLAMIFTALIAGYVVENGMLLVNRIVDEEIKSKRIKDTLARYVSVQVADEILKSKPGFLMRGEKRDVTILLSDIRGFTQIAENISAEEVVELLNAYFSRMIDIVFKYRGTLDKFMGDAILVVFGAPMPDNNHAENAARTALEMQNVVNDFNIRQKELNKPEISIGIGLHSGSVIAGNIGSEKRLEYTVIGDTVNVTQRVESCTGKGDIYITHEVYEQIKNLFDIETLSEVKVKGRVKPVKLYKLICSRKTVASNS